MPPLNYHYLRYFWAVAREGGLRKAADRLNVSQPTISAQVKALEEQLGRKLTRRDGRGLTLTEEGRHVFEYAEQIFALGQELVDSLETPARARPVRVALGVTDSLPKFVGHALMRPLFRQAQPVHVVVTKGSAAELLVKLAAHRLDDRDGGRTGPKLVPRTRVQPPARGVRRIVSRESRSGRPAAGPLPGLSERGAHPAAHPWRGPAPFTRTMVPGRGYDASHRRGVR